MAAYIGDEEIDTGFHVTSPEFWLLQPLLRKIEQKGFTHLVLEVTSHVLDQNRFVGVKFYVGVITNIDMKSIWIVMEHLKIQSG